MKANELMTGDWCLLNKRPKKVSVLTIFGEDVGISDHWYPLKCIEPIPLTPEILEKNGWKYDVFGWYDCDGIDFSVIISDGEEIGISVSNIDTATVWIHYVHELQHALRLCGLNEIADIFRVD